MMFEVEKGHSINLSNVISMRYDGDMNNIYFKMSNNDLIVIEDMTLRKYQWAYKCINELLSTTLNLEI